MKIYDSRIKLSLLIYTYLLIAYIYNDNINSIYTLFVLSMRILKICKKQRYLVNLLFNYSGNNVPMSVQLKAVNHFHKKLHLRSLEVFKSTSGG